MAPGAIGAFPPRPAGRRGTARGSPPGGSRGGPGRCGRPVQLLPALPRRRSRSLLPRRRNQPEIGEVLGGGTGGLSGEGGRARRGRAGRRVTPAKSLDKSPSPCSRPRAVEPSRRGTQNACTWVLPRLPPTWPSGTPTWFCGMSRPATWGRGGLLGCGRLGVHRCGSSPSSPTTCALAPRAPAGSSLKNSLVPAIERWSADDRADRTRRDARTQHRAGLPEARRGPAPPSTCLPCSPRAEPWRSVASVLLEEHVGPPTPQVDLPLRRHTEEALRIGDRRRDHGDGRSSPLFNRALGGAGDRPCSTPTLVLRRHGAPAVVAAPASQDVRRRGHRQWNRIRTIDQGGGPGRC